MLYTEVSSFLSIPNPVPQLLLNFRGRHRSAYSRTDILLRYRRGKSIFQPNRDRLRVDFLVRFQSRHPTSSGHWSRCLSSSFVKPLAGFRLWTNQCYLHMTRRVFIADKLLWRLLLDLKKIRSAVRIHCLLRVLITVHSSTMHKTKRNTVEKTQSLLNRTRTSYHIITKKPSACGWLYPAKNQMYLQEFALWSLE